MTEAENDFIWDVVNIFCIDYEKLRFGDLSEKFSGFNNNLLDFGDMLFNYKEIKNFWRRLETPKNFLPKDLIILYKFSNSYRVEANKQMWIHRPLVRDRIDILKHRKELVEEKTLQEQSSETKIRKNILKTATTTKKKTKSPYVIPLPDSIVQESKYGYFETNKLRAATGKTHDLTIVPAEWDDKEFGDFDKTIVILMEEKKHITVSIQFSKKVTGCYSFNLAKKEKGIIFSKNFSIDGDAIEIEGIDKDKYDEADWWGIRKNE